MEIDAQAEVCPICQYEFPKQSKVSIWVAVLLIVVLLLLFLFDMTAPTSDADPLPLRPEK